MKIRFIVAILVCLSTAAASAQKMQLEKVSVEDLKQKRHAKDTAAIAAVLGNKARTTFVLDRKQDNFNARHEFIIRIKIYKKEGLRFANYEIPYYIGYKNLKPEILEINDAVTYNLVDGKVQKTKVGGTGTFKEKVNTFWKIATVVFPDVKEGSIIEFRYTLKSENIHVFPTFKFQRDIPVDYAEYKTEIPVNYQYKAVVKGFRPIQTDAKTQSGSQSYENKYGQTETLHYTLNVFTHSASDLRAVRDEEFVDNAENYRTAIDYELELIQFPNAPVRNFSQTWDGLAGTIYKDEDFGGQLKQTDYFLGPLKKLVEGIDAKEERMKKVFAFVQDRMNWNGHHNFYTDKGVKAAWESQTGNIADINLMLISMLNMAGVEAYPVLVSTVGNGVASYPNQSAFNYVMGAAIIDGKKILLDAAHKFTTPGIVPVKTLNWNGRLIRQDGSSEELAMTPSAVSRRNYSIMCDIQADGFVTGKSRLHLTDFAALEFRDRFSGVDKENYTEQLEKHLEDIEVNNYAVENDKKSTEPVIESYDFKSAHHAEIIGDKIYVDPMLFLTMRHNPFTSDERLTPVFLGYPKQSRYLITFKLPEGYAVESLPKPLTLATDGNVVSFKILFQNNQNSITVSALFESAMMLVNSQYYSVVKDFYTQLVNKELEKIVLKKV